MSKVSEKIRTSYAAGDNLRDQDLTIPKNIQRYVNISYGNDKNWQLLDVYRPKDKQGEMLPVIFSIHGGAWEYGDKDRCQYYCMSLALRGFVVINFTYRLAPEFQFPAPLEDTNLVVQWMLKNADQYDMDSKHIFGVGDSAGANDLGLYAAICTNPEYASMFPFQVPRNFKPTAIALNCGVYQYMEEDLDELYEGVMNDYMPHGAVQSELDKISVPAYVTENYVPTCLMTCNGDPLKDQALLMFHKLLDCNVPFQFQFYGDKDHILGHVFHLNMRSEIASKCNDAQCEWFREFL